MIKLENLSNKKITVGLVNTSSTPCTFPNRFERAVNALKESGFEVKFPKNFYKNDGYFAGTPSERAGDVMELVNNKEVNLILSTTGGLNTLEILEYLDFQKIKECKKVFCGFSDFTVILLAIYFKTGIESLYGPALLPSFGEFGGINPYTLEWFQKNLDNSEIIKFDLPQKYSKEEHFWDKEDNKELCYQDFPGLEILRFGSATGKIIACNLESIIALTGTQYMQIIQEPFILFIENTMSDTATIKRDLKHLELVGFLKNITGVVYGLPKRTQIRGSDSIQDVLKEYFLKYNVPVIFGFPFGHLTPVLTLKIGANCMITTMEKNVNITLLNTI